ncbi:MAG: 23S rRNA (guanosine(2251)-2'-O)-methyltransferase RlmB [Bacteroidia bacterium]|jgi:23S rRNA (guanosine2251-2'-O)-methyltransferase|nr:23S rRNA (guanosine(2251)-2'-O)-methyltransferase RlmB [Bacteroidia bacterium]
MSFKRKPTSSNLIYGIHAIQEAIAANKQVNKVMIQQGESSELMQQLLQLLKSHQIPVQYLPKHAEVFPKGKNHQGAAASVSPVTYYKLEDIIPDLFEKGEVPFIVVLDRITDVRNFGAIARSAFCAGVHALVIPEQGGAMVTEDAVKTSAGALHHIPVCREKNLKSTMELLNQSGLVTIACTEKASRYLHQCDLTVPVAIIMGNEETGISNDIIKKCSEMAMIPLNKGVQSLNVSVAAGIAVYETVKQRM